MKTGSLEEAQQTNIEVANFTFCVQIKASCQLDLTAVIEQITDIQNTFLIRFVANRTDGQPLGQSEFSLCWDVPLVDMHGWFSVPPSPAEMAQLPYWQVNKRSAANYGLPFVALFHRNGDNRAAFGLLDQLTETLMDAELSELTGCYHFHWQKSIGQVGTSYWEEVVFVSTEKKPFQEVYYDYLRTVDIEWPQPQMPVPKHAFEPVFCTWTAVHHAVNQAWILRTARLAADLGFGTWLTDDGWFTDQASFADYRYAGDWESCTTKFDDFAGHVKQVQTIGMHYILWVAPFMVGQASQATQTYSHLLTGLIPDRHFANLSPQQAETEDIITSFLTRLVLDYGLDGFKLDFIGRIPPGCDLGRDPAYATQGIGIYNILSHAIDNLRDINPDVLIEFRYPYANLASRRYANVYRAYDSPLNPTTNRWQVVTLRLLAPDRAVHLDPALWHPDDSDENVAVHLINLLVSVPMVGIDLEHYPQSHLDLIRHWIAFYRDHQDTIIYGKFVPEFHLGNVPLIRFNSEHERIIALYDDIAFALGDISTPLWILNASTRPFVELLPSDSAHMCHVITYDKFGRSAAEATLQMLTSHLSVEVGGSVKVHAVQE